MNVGRPVEPGRAAVTLAMGQTLGDATYVRRPYVDSAAEGPYPQPGRVHVETSEGAGIPGSFTLGFRYGPLGGFDFGAEAGFGSGGVTTRILLLDTAPVDLVLTADAHIGAAGPCYDGTTRLLGFVPFNQRRNVAVLLGLGGSGGRYRHYTWHGGAFFPLLRPLQRREARAEALLGVSFTRAGDGAELVVFADGYWIPWAEQSVAFAYEQTLGILLAMSVTLPFGSKGN